MNVTSILAPALFWLAIAIPFGSLAQHTGSTNDPSITQQPQSVVGTIGGTATFSVTAQGTQPLSYQWDLNSSPIAGATNTSLTISNIQVADEGAYFVIVSNSIGTVTSTVATLGLPLSVASGTYVGVFTNSGSLNTNTSGFCTITVSKGGGFTLKVQIGTRHYSGRSLLSAFGGAQLLATSGRQMPLTVALQGSGQNANTLDGAIWTENWGPEPFVLSRNSFDKRTNPNPVQGQYTMIFEPGDAGSNALVGVSVASVKIDAAGAVRFTGTLADESKISGSSMLSDDFQFPLFAAGSGGRAFVLGQVMFTTNSASPLAGTVLWLKPPGRSGSYSNGFFITNIVSGSPYFRPGSGQKVLKLSQAELVLQSGALAQPMLIPVSLDEKNRLSSTGPEVLLRASISRSTGLMTGKLRSSVFSGTIPLRGVALQSENLLTGFFFADGLSGRLDLGAAQ